MDSREIIRMVRRATRRCTEYLHSFFHSEDGAFYGDCIFNAYVNSAYLILLDNLEIDHPRKSDIIEWIARHQNADGSWGDILEGGTGNYQFTLVASVALEGYIDGCRIDKARQWIKNCRDDKWIDPYTRLAVYTKTGNIELFSPPWWTFLVPARVAKAFGKLQMRFPRLFWWSIFLYPSTWTRNASYSLAVAKIKHSGLKPALIERIVLKWLERVILNSQLDNGSWYDLGRTTRGSIYALSLLGYDKESNPIRRGLQFLASRLGFRGNINGLRLPVWDTALSLIAFSEYLGTGENLKQGIMDAIRNSLSYILKSYNTTKGGWSFDYYMKHLPDNDDTALAIIALKRFKYLLKSAAFENIKSGALDYLRRMQNDDGGWGAFLKNQCYKFPGRIPPFHEEHGHELKDPSTADVTGHVLQALGEVYGLEKGRSKIVNKAIDFLRHDQLEFGGWWGRWGIGYIYGTTQVLQGIRAVNEDMTQKYVQKSVRWLLEIQNDDGGWGEHYTSQYSNYYISADSTVEQTSWAVIALLDSGVSPYSEPIRGAVRYLLRTQREDGSFPSAYVASAIDPGKYESYSAIFPLWALSKWISSAIDNGGNVK